MNVRRHGLATVSALIIAAALIGMGCGNSSVNKPPDYKKALQDAPAQLSSLYSEANQLLPGGEDAYAKRLQQLRGYPVVVNLWASWCGNCRFEFPFLQRLSARFGTRVAFLGIDAEDSDEAAARWLEEAPVPYPSFKDPDREIADSLGVIGFPDTAFYDRQGDLVFLKQGPYHDPDELEDQIKDLLREKA